MGDNERAADAYDRYLLDTEGRECEEHEERGRANAYLAGFMIEQKQFDQAEEFAKKTINCAEVGPIVLMAK